MYISYVKLYQHGRRLGQNRFRLVSLANSSVTLNPFSPRVSYGDMKCGSNFFESVNETL